MSDLEEVRKELEALRVANRQLEENKLVMEVENTRLTQEAEAAKAVISTREASPATRKELGLQSMIKLWSGEASGPPVSEFIRSLEMVAATGGWSDRDSKMICRLKTTGAAAACLDAHPELLKSESTFEDFKKVLRRRFEGLVDPERNLMALNSIQQINGETALAFADRCRKLGLKTLRPTCNVQEAAWAREQMERTVLAAYVKGLRGPAATQLQFYPPKDMDEATQNAERVEQALLNQRNPKDVFYYEEDNASGTYEVASATKNVGKGMKENSCFECGGRGHYARDCANRKQNPRHRGTPAAGRSGFCYVCADPNHFAARCPRRARKPQEGKYQSFTDNVDYSPQPAPNAVGSVAAPPPSL